MMGDPKPKATDRFLLQFMGAPSQDEMPVSRVARAAEIGRLGARLSTIALRAGAAGIGARGNERERLRSQLRAESAASLLDSLGRMRGVAAKFGQLLVQRPGVLPDEYMETLFDLSNRVPPMGYSMVKNQFLSELSRPPTQVFAKFERQPLASASFGQVHRAELPDGTEVAVKVQYPAIEQSLRSDLQNLRLLAQAAAAVADIKNAEEVLLELEDHLYGELDYRAEAESQKEFRRLFDHDGVLRVPSNHAAYSSRRILTSDLLDGVDLRTYLASAPSDDERAHYGETILQFGWASIHRHALLHADPNPGNYMFMKARQLGVVDFGCVKRFDDGFVENLRMLTRASMRGDERMLEEAMLRGGLVAPDASSQEMESARQLAREWGRPFAQSTYDFSDRKYLDGLLKVQEMLTHMVRRDARLMPRDWLFYGRHIVGTTYLLYKLGMRVRTREAVEPFIEGPRA